MPSSASAYANEEKLYRASKKAWSRSSPAFSSKTSRFAAQAPTTDALRDGAYDSIENKMKHSRQRLSPAFMPSNSASRSHSCNSADQAPATPSGGQGSGGAAGFYDVGRTLDIGRAIPSWKKGSTAFSSTTPRFGVPSPTPSADGDEQRAATPSQKPVPSSLTKRTSRGAVAYLSKQPRLPPSKEPVCQGDYNVKLGTFDQPRAGHGRVSPWAMPPSSRSPSAEQQASTAQPSSGPDYPTRLPIGIDAGLRKYTVHSAFHSTTPRFANSARSADSETPGPGAYASRFIAYGMQS